MIEPTLADDPRPRQAAAGGPLPGIDRVCVINLDRRPDRLRSFYAHLPDGLDRRSLGRFAAVDGRSLEPDEPLRHLFRGNDFDYRRGVVACALSHYGLWRELCGSEDRSRTTLVLEDDVIFCTDFVRRWSSTFHGELPRAFDLIYLGGPSVTLEEAEDLAATGADLDLPPADYVATRTHRSFGVPLRSQFGTFAYLVTGAGARRLCRRVEDAGMQRAVDWFLIDAWPRLRVFTAIPLLCWGIRNHASDVQQNYAKLFPDTA